MSKSSDKKDLVKNKIVGRKPKNLYNDGPVKFIIKSLVPYEENDELREGDIQRMKNNFIPILNEPIVVGILASDGTHHVGEGHHRVALAQARGETEILGYPLELKSLKELPMYYKLFSRAKKYKSLLQEFKASVKEEVSWAVEIENIVHNNGFKIAQMRDDNNLTCLTEVLYIVRKYGISILDKTLAVNRIAWDGSNISLSKKMIKGLGIFMNRYSDSSKFDLADFGRRLGETSIKNLIMALEESCKEVPLQDIALDRFTKIYNQGRARYDKI